MLRWGLFDLTLDACPKHGMWFDKWELAEVMHAEMAGSEDPRRFLDEECSGIGDLLAYLSGIQSD